MSHSLLDTLTLRGLFIGQFYLITTDVSRNSAAGAAAQSGYFDQRHAEDTVRLLFFLSTEEVQGSEEATSLTLTATAGSHCWDLRQPWGSLQVRVPGGWGR